MKQRVYTARADLRAGMGATGSQFDAAAALRPIPSGIVMTNRAIFVRVKEFTGNPVRRVFAG
jgi:hypothetical protein